jgi:hypothetical protein
VDEQLTEPEVDQTETEIQTVRAELEGARGAERAAVARLREVLLASEPALEPSMVAGDTLAEVEASFATASALLARLRERAATEALVRVPAGAPGRSNPRPRTAFEKIRDGLGKAS